MKGNENLGYHWNETTWLFSSKANLDSFKLNPQKYAPQFGGYCAYGVWKITKRLPIRKPGRL